MCRALAINPELSLSLYSPDLIRADVSGLESAAFSARYDK